MPGVALRVGRGIALLFHDRGTRRGWVVSSTPRLHFTPGKDPVTIAQEAGWAPGPVWTGAENFAPTGIRSRTFQPRSSVAIPTELPGPHAVQVLALNPHRNISGSIYIIHTDCVTTGIAQFLICPCIFLKFQGICSMTLSLVIWVIGGRILWGGYSKTCSPLW